MAQSQLAYDPDKPYTAVILEMIQETWPSNQPDFPWPISVELVGSAPVVHRDAEFSEKYCESKKKDGIGTKGELHWQMHTFKEAAQDGFAMNANDLSRYGFTPYMAMDHVSLPDNDREAIFAVARGFIDLCLEYDVALVGGETSIMNTLRGLELSVQMDGLAEKGRVLQPTIRPGDIVIGIESSGVHSNGLTEMRRVFLDELGMRLDDPLPLGHKIGQELTKPTHIYTTAVNHVLDAYFEHVHGFEHITGGAFTRLKKLCREECDIRINAAHELKPQEIFHFFKAKSAYTDETMYSWFNCGIGYVGFVAAQHAEPVLKTLRKFYRAAPIGIVTRGDGKIEIESAFEGGRKVTL